MKRITAMLLSLLLGAGLLTVCWRGAEYHREDTERENGVTLYVRRDRQAAFAGNLTWDGQSDTVDYVIPDRVDGAPVTALGGLLYGTAFKKLPYGWGLALPQTFRGAKQYHLEPPENATPVTLTVHLHLGALCFPYSEYGRARCRVVLRRRWELPPAAAVGHYLR